MSLVRVDRLPNHMAIVMDGNGRWAKQRGMPRYEGHRRGVLVVRETVRAATRLGIKALTLYAFSEQNWSRPEPEVNVLMSLLTEFLRSERPELKETSVKLRGIGRLSRLPAATRDLLDEIGQDVPEPRCRLSLALSYGGQEEIADGMQELAKRVKRGELAPEDIDDKLVGSVLPSMDVGPPDLILRTSGDQRISNFLLWGSAYAELVFTDVLWPDFTAKDLFKAVAEYQGRERRFGGVEAKVLAAAQ